MSKNIFEHSYKPSEHFLLDIFKAKSLCDINFIEDALKESAIDAGCTILNSNFHQFGKNAGVTGVLILAESHISIHTWPEIEYAALDVFMCGNCKPKVAVDKLIKLFSPDRYEIKSIKRG